MHRKTIPAGEAVVIEGNGTKSFIYASESNTSIEPNDLKGVYVDTHVSEGETYFTLQSENETLGFYKHTGDSLEAFKAYIAQTDIPGCNGFPIKNNATGIDSLPNKPVGIHSIFDLTGKRIFETKSPGVYIINGKKIMILK